VSSPDSTAPRERRAFVRFVCDLETWCQPAGDATPAVSVTIEDLSGNGLSLRANQAFEPGTLLNVQWPGITDIDRYTVAVCVVRSIGPTNGTWSVGCTFVRQLNENDLQRLGITREAPAASDQRRWTRFPCDLRAYYDLVTSDEPEQLPANVLDVSPSGLGLLVSNPLAVGSVLTLDLVDQGLTLLVCVLRVETHGDGWMAGCSLLRTLNEQELRAWL
jgi:hypothetical protein